MKIECRSMIGENNRKLKRECQDSYSIQNSKGVTAVCVCDGAGFSNNSAIAATEISRAVAKLMIEYYYKWNPDEVRIFISKYIDNELFILANQYGVKYSELATTIMAVCLKDGEEINMLHLGDGNIFVKKAGEDKLYPLSSAQSGMIKNQTYLTGSDKTSSYIRTYTSFNNPVYEKIYMVTDGCGCDCECDEDKKLNCLLADACTQKDDYTIVKIDV